MSKTLYEDERELTRSELVAELRRIAADLESSAQFSFGDGEVLEQVSVSDRLKREIEVERTKDGNRMKVEIEFAWNA
ncbi:hypothetical protein A9W97_02495 [Mycobacterium gordonae]|nr:amphi-Trp domain-containing protein [Mycobacterium gordonae]OBJ81404.1 hypothetical protein A9W97_02495 [Mycobacterium gordonae]